MIGVIRSELMRLRRGSFVFGGVGLLAGFSALISIFVLSAAGEEAGDGPGPASTRSVAELEAPGGSLASFETLSNLVGVVVLAYWAIAVASDYGTGLIRILAQAEPRRLRLLGGKVIALVAATVAGTAIVTLVATALARPLAELNDVSSDRWSTDFAIEVLGSFAKLTVSALVWGLVGLLVAVISRSSGVAIAVGVGDLLVVENLVSIVAEGRRTTCRAARWPPWSQAARRTWAMWQPWRSPLRTRWRPGWRRPWYSARGTSSPRGAAAQAGCAGVEPRSARHLGASGESTTLAGSLAVGRARSSEGHSRPMCPATMAGEHRGGPRQP